MCVCPYVCVYTYSVCVVRDTAKGVQNLELFKQFLHSMHLCSLVHKQENFFKNHIFFLVYSRACMYVGVSAWVGV